MLVYPDFVIEAALSFELDADERTKEKTDLARTKQHHEKRGRPAQTDWKIEVSGAIAFGRHKTELSIALEDKLRRWTTVNRMIKRALQGALKILFEMSASFGSSGYVGFGFGAECKGNTGVAARLELDHDHRGVYLKGKFVLLECTVECAAWASGKFFFELKQSYEKQWTYWEERDLLETGNKYVVTGD